MTIYKCIIAFAILLLGACSTIGVNPDDLRDGAEDNKTLGQEFADRLLAVKPEHRALRICLLAAGTSELMVDGVRLFGNTDVPGLLGQIDTMSGTVAVARSGSNLWLETEMANTAFVFVRVFEEKGREQFGRILLGGLSVSNFLQTIRRGAVVAYKASAMLRDAENMFRGLEDNTYTEQQIWDACESRITLNRNILRYLSGIRPPSQ